MKLLFVALLTMACTASANTEERAVPEINRLLEYHNPQTPSNAFVAMGPGFVLGEQKSRPGINLEIVGNLLPEFPLYAGMEWGTYFETGGQFTAIFALWPTLFTLMDASDSIHPVLGISAGPVLSTAVGDDFRMAGLIKPGVIFDVTSSVAIAFHSKFGVIGPNFVFVPTLSTSFAI